MTKIATFSNGHTDTYKGSRDVKAAWAIISKETGKVVMSGHSMDRAKADKTANGRLQELGSDRFPYVMPTKPYPGRDKVLVRNGYTGTNRVTAQNAWAREQNALRLEDIRSRHTIEIIDI